ncbi:hypothetical protein [Thermus albus]|nr:hypothetical protein [Thermus albus]
MLRLSAVKTVALALFPLPAPWEKGLWPPKAVTCGVVWERGRLV